LISTDRIEQLYREHHALVLQAAYRVTGRLEDAEDVLQTVFLRLSRREEEENLLKNAGGYLRRAAVNCGIDLLRSRKSARATALEDLAGVLTDDSSRTPDRLHHSREIREWLRKEVAAMSPKMAEIFTLRYLEGFGNSEIAEMLETSPASIAVTLNRARERVTDNYRKQMGGNQHV
jgi:RNA polymerase sigma-70 factor (ECF subfamily)